MKKEIVQVPRAKPVPYLSRVVRFGSLVFVSGTTGRDPETGELASEDLPGQARQTLENIKAGLAAAGGSLQDVLKMTCYLVDIAEKPAFDRVYIEYFPTDPPARTCVEVAALAPGVKVEIEAIAGAGPSLDPGQG